MLWSLIHILISRLRQLPSSLFDASSGITVTDDQMKHTLTLKKMTQQTIKQSYRNFLDILIRKMLNIICLGKGYEYLLHHWE